jgi:hypothetical protein
MAGGKATLPLLGREMLKIEVGDYPRANINQVVKKSGWNKRINLSRAASNERSLLTYWFLTQKNTEPRT